MKRNAIFLASAFFLTSLCFSTSGCAEDRPPKTCDTFEEMADPTADTLSDWSNVTKGLHVSFASIDTRYPKSVAPDISKVSATQLTGWKGEKVSAQVLIWSAEEKSQLECEFSNFTSPASSLPADAAQARFVRYVMTDEFAAGCGYRKPEDFAASLAADMLDNIDCIDLPAKTVRPVWVTVSIPEAAEAGTYKGKLIVYADRKKQQELEIELNVQNRTLPPASQWSYYLDLWQHPSAVARAQKLELWSDAHFEAMKPLYKLLADAGQKVITATLNKDAWNNQCYDRYEDMIIWTKHKDGSWTYDYTIFDKWISFMMSEVGINKTINCYSMVPWNNELCYKDEASGETITVKADPGTDIFKKVWTPFLTDFVKHLKEKGWFEKTNIAMDERSPAAMDATISLIQEVAPEIGISLADNHKSYKRYPFIREMTVAAGARVEEEDIKMRRENRLITNYYVCCSDKFPNVFTFSDPAEATYSAWYAFAAGYDGYLRWAYNSWVENPLTDSRFRTWPAGDTYIVYPEARSSIRFERLIEGIQDMEKVRILREEFEKNGNKESLNSLNSTLEKFNTIELSIPCSEMLKEGKAIIEKLSE
ncbi:MAG: DUF4091 domain-containing protein [Prevotella sp.]|jgi:hypothetical protein|nr:DUF4091 domain-containing protein [Prevotella sp.]